MGHITSASGVLALLDEPEQELQVFALERINQIIDIFWPEIADHVQKIEALEESKAFGKRQLAAHVVSKVYFHLGSYSDCLTYALRSGDLLSEDSNELYIDTVKEHAIDHYISQRASGDTVALQLETLLQQLFTLSLKQSQYRHAVGISLETKRMDWFTAAIGASSDPVPLMQYSYRMAMTYILEQAWKSEVVSKLVELYSQHHSTPDYINMCQCLIHLDRHAHIAQILSSLVKDDSLKTEKFDPELMAYQLGFDLYESATQDLLCQIQKELRLTAPIPSLLPSVESRKPAPEGEAMETDGEVKAEKMEEGEVKPVGEETEKEKTVAVESVKKLADLTADEKSHQSRITRVMTILQGSETILQHLQFLISNNKSDMLILRNTKDLSRHSICHTATVIANGFMHCGTTSDVFLRDNLEWLSRATNWAKMTATASLGVVHRGHEKEALTLMQAYLPRETNSPGYVESGSLYALGLIHANHGGAIVDYLLGQTRDTASEVVRHGGCLGLGLAALGTQRVDIYEELHKYVLTECAVTGEAAGLAMGLVMMGSAHPRVLSEMLDQARGTTHEKITRGLIEGIAITMYGQTNRADSLIEELLVDKNALMRRCGMYVIAMAYCGTASVSAMRQLLHVAVSDVDNDVRRSAVEALGFLMFRHPEQVPSLVSLLAESYNPHVRYGAAMCLGISCAGTGLKEALALLEPLINDPVNFVRQAACVASALVLVQQNEATCPKIKEWRQYYSKNLPDKHEDNIAKFGSILSQGIIDAGGRNVTIALQSRTGHTNMTAVIGLFVFTQFWYWFPLSHFLSLAFTPTCVIGLNKELKMPKVAFVSHAKPSTYAYPPPLEEKKREVHEKVTAVLSITAKAKRKDDARKSKESHTKEEEKMDVDEDVKSAKEEPPKKKKVEDKAGPPKKKDSDQTKEKDAKKDEDESKTKKPKEEPSFDTLSNPARVMRQQLKVLKMAENARYVPVKEINIGGIILLRDTKETEEELVQPVAAMGPATDEETEPSPPTPFEWTE